MVNVKISFFLKSRFNKQRHQPIVMTICINKTRTQVFTGIWIHQSKWDQRKKQVKGNHEEVNALNDTLAALRTKIRQISNELLLSGREFNALTIKQRINEGFTKDLGVLTRFQVFLDRMKAQIGGKYTLATHQKYANTKLRISEFIKDKFKRNDIFLYELETSFIEDFEIWLRKKFKVNHNTIYKSYQRFTRFIRYEVNVGNLEKYPFPNYELKMQFKQGHFLTFDEIKSLENSKQDSIPLEQTRLLFLFCCFSGLAFIDMYNLTIDNLIKDEEGILWIKSTRQKSKSRVSIPLISNAINILNELRSGKFLIKEGKLLPIKANIHLNLEIKRVCALAGIENANKVSFHSARRSTSSLMIKAGVPLQILQKVLSHKSIGTTLQFYTHSDDIMVAKAMKELDSKLNNK